MAIHRLRTRQVVPVSLDEMWAFYSNPRNLALITPDLYGFRITSDPPERMYPGLMITFEMRPLPGVAIAYSTVITHVEERVRFVDEQRFEPYSLWHHQHEFREVEGGTEVLDDMHYLFPGGPVGDLVARYIMRPQLHDLFRFRRDAIRERFGPPPASA